MKNRLYSVFALDPASDLRNCSHVAGANALARLMLIIFLIPWAPLEDEDEQARGFSNGRGGYSNFIKY